MSSTILMNKWVKILCPALFLVLRFSDASPATIQGHEPDYAGEKLIFNIYTDPVTKDEKELFEINIDKNGNFKSDINVSSTVYCHSEFDTYEGLLILEPSSILTLRLPKKQVKTALQSKNPYFQPVVIWLVVESDQKNEVNYLVEKLEDTYARLTAKYFNQLYLQRSGLYVDSVRTTLEKEFGGYSQPVFRDQLNFKLKLLQADVNELSQKSIFKGVRPNNSIWTNPAFTELLNLVFDNKLSFEANAIGGGELRNAVNNGNVEFIKNFFIKKYELDPGLADLVLLKLLYEGYYSNNFSKPAIISMLGNKLFSDNPDNNIRIMATNIKKKLLYLSPGSAAPVICLNDLAGQQHCSGQLHGYKYILFADAEMLVCREHLKYLATIASGFGDKLGIFVVIKYSQLKETKDFLTKNDIPGTIVMEKPDNRYATEYRVRAYPSAFLLDDENNVILAPAKNPLDGFQQQFAAFLRTEQLKKLKNQK